MGEEKNIEGLGGWLVLVGLGIVISPIRIIFTMFPIYSEIFTNGSWELLTTPGGEAYSPLWGSIIIGEILGNGALVLAWLFISFLFFTKKKEFPAWYIGTAIFTLIFILLDALAIKLVMPNEPVFDPETVKELSRALVGCVIWVPYMLLSKRVKATFIK